MTKQTAPSAEKSVPQSDSVHDKKPDAKKTCADVLNELNGYLAKQNDAMANLLKPCTSCQVNHPGWPVINAPFDAQKLNTGFDGVNGALPDNSIDLNWEAGLGTPNTLPTSWIPAFVYRDNAWLPSPFSNANWISYYADAAHSTNQDVYFRIRFYLNNNVNPAQFALDMDFYADNSVQEIYINGLAQSLNFPSLLPQAPTLPYDHVGFAAGKQVHITLDHDWQACENEVIVHVKSGPGYVGFLAQNATKCYEANIPNLAPVINIAWGDGPCDCLETDDFEVMYLTVCNPFSNVIFKNMSIGRIRVVDSNGNPVPILPDGTDSVAVHPVGPYCFGDIQPCTATGGNCVSRQFVLINRGAKDGKYKIILEGICFDVCAHYDFEACFEFSLCKS